ncbi:hypothetical protein Droror1_Dr00026781 [Drosera rotundifolia]
MGKRESREMTDRRQTRWRRESGDMTARRQDEIRKGDEERESGSAATKAGERREERGGERRREEERGGGGVEAGKWSTWGSIGMELRDLSPPFPLHQTDHIWSTGRSIGRNLTRSPAALSLSQPRSLLLPAHPAASTCTRRHLPLLRRRGLLPEFAALSLSQARLPTNLLSSPKLVCLL